jgi:hypothetical protein
MFNADTENYNILCDARVTAPAWNIWLWGERALLQKLSEEW